jgi:hypothetical protein
LSQLANPLLQEAIWQLPLAQLAVAFGWLLHAWLHAPQFVSVLSCASQPLVCALPSQLPQPLLHAIEQVPAVQLGVPLALLQTVPQLPQLETVVTTVSQPLFVLLSQLP